MFSTDSVFARLRDSLLKAYMRMPEHPAKYRIVRWLGRHVFPERGIPCHVYPDTNLYLHPRDWIEYQLLRGERYEPETLDFLAANLGDDDVAILAGVNFGLHVAVAARHVGDRGVVIGIEPQPAALLRAAQNLRLNGVQHRVKLVSVALGHQEQLAHMAWAASDNPGAASLLDEGSGLTVQVMRLSRLVETLSLKQSRLLLLDVQGVELQVLAGLGERWRPEILVVEVDAGFLERGKTTERQLLQAIVDLGYSLYTLRGEAATEGTVFPEGNVICAGPGSQVRWPAKISA